MSNINPFKNEKMNEVFRENKSFVDEHLKKLDELSHDIKNLEALLKKSAVKGPIEFILNEKSKLIWDGNKVRWVSGDLDRRLIETPLQIRISVSDKLGTFFDLCLSTIRKI